MIVDEEVYARIEMDTSGVNKFLEHHGVKGMKWGQRRNRKAQSHIDRIHRVATGTASVKDRTRVAAETGVVTKKGAAQILKRGVKLQENVKKGRGFITNKLLQFQGVSVSQLNYPRPSSSK